ncbi:MAG: sensor histidine kinase [Flavicella sp.]
MLHLILTFVLFTSAFAKDISINHEYKASFVENKLASFDLSQEKQSKDLKKWILNLKSVATKNQTEKKVLLEYFEILKIAKKRNENNILIDVNAEISEILLDINSFKKSLNYAKEALKYAEIERDTLAIIERNIKIGKIHYKLYNKNKIKYANQLDSLYYYNKVADEIIGNNTKYLKQKGKIYSSYSVVSLLKKDYTTAQKNNLKALEINIQNNDTVSQIINLNTLAGNYIKQKDFEKAVFYYKKSLELIGKDKNKKESELKRMVSSNIAWAYYNLKNHISYEYLYKSFKIDDSLRNEEFRAIITEIEAKHNVDIIQQNADKKRIIEVQQKEKFQLWTFILAISTLLITYFFWIYSKNSKLKNENKDLMLVKAGLEKQKEIELLKSEHQTKVLNATLDGKEVERRDIAETLHNNVSVLLSAANLHLQASINNSKEKTDDIIKTQKIIDEASSKIRNLSHELISSVLLKFGLSYAIQDFCEKLSNSELEIICKINSIKRYPQNFEIKINSMIEELVNNIIKHSKAKHGYISIHEKGNQLNVEVFDDGIGFDTQINRYKKGIGIQQIEARIMIMKGTFKLNSAVNEGTKINFKVPIPNK